MDPELKQYILHLIRNSFVHSTTVAEYSAYLIGGDLSNSEFMITVKYSHTDAADVWCEYELFFQKTPVYKMILPLNIPIYDDLAQDMMEILKKCSQKIIAQEKMAQKNMFLRTINDSQFGQEY